MRDSVHVGLVQSCGQSRSRKILIVTNNSRAPQGGDMMLRLLSMTITISVLTSSQLNAADNRVLTWLVETTRKTSFEDLSGHRAIHYLLDIAKHCHALGEKELADELFQRAIQVVEADEKGRFWGLLVKHAIHLGKLDLAEKYAMAAGTLKDTYLDQLDIAKYKTGEKDAIKDYPRAKQDFHNALDLATALIDQGEYDKAEEYVTDIKISEENDPLAVTGITFERIAQRCLEQGDTEGAKKYIDKAVAVGGNLFYTGYSLKVTQKAIHGTLKQGLDKFARLAVAHRGHMARELLMSLIRELIGAKHYTEAKRVAKMLKKDSDIHEMMSAIATSQAKALLFRDAYDTIDEIKEVEAKNLARLGLATSLLQAGKPEIARKHADSVLMTTLAKPDEEVSKQTLRLISVYALLGDASNVEKLVNRSSDSSTRIARIHAAFRSIAENKATLKPNI